MKLLVDGDIIAYKAASACDGRQYVVRYLSNGNIITQYESYKKDADAIVKSLENEGYSPTCELEYEPEPLENVKAIIDSSMEDIVRACKDHYGEPIGPIKVYLSSGGSFREREYPAYKGNRENIRRPKHLEAAKMYLLDNWDSQCIPGEYEADDLMAMNQGPDTVICTVDKDLLQVPGNHYNFAKKKFSIISEEEGNRNLYKQMLTGDTSDGIPGIKGIGPKTAEKIIGDLRSPRLMYIAVLKTYYEKTPREDGETEEDFQNRVVQLVRTHARLLYLLRWPEDSWEAPVDDKLRHKSKGDDLWLG